MSDLDSVLHDKLAAVGLVRKRGSMTLGPYLDSYIATRSDVKVSTATVYGHTRRCLVEFFGADKALRDITPGDADEWRIWLGEHDEHRGGKVVKVQLADNTVARRCGIAKQFFRTALRKGLVLQNPFADLKAGIKRNTSRYYFVSRAEADAVLDACPDAEWRLLFALSRFGGLRCPSEHLRLRWADVDWSGGRITVHASKTEHHEGKATRVIPIFPELRPHLEAVWEQAESGSEYVITRYRDPGQNLRTQLERIISKATGADTMAQAVPESPRYPRDRAGRDISDARRLRMDRQQRGDRGETLPASDRRALSKSGAQSGAVPCCS